ncbi:putative 5-methyltetrahydropteroyltriglutamate-- homocysteine S-methyltransferase [Clostridium perfringens D str. JGS1721]|uniref:Putative 5-methyltetrahydropteroyltriglutamate--homocysteine S-methyltransferase n=1 Tax=Clostridium perfringens D str. JGS1721 TaxID=488537 RepID=B1V1F1_CLOPF|nr:putative 5-methyltetrahydropteroyltriglutamate-- homocysteine S-methyltransferase [Clostridium perfringens D str. JGS1721]
MFFQFLYLIDKINSITKNPNNIKPEYSKCLNNMAKKFGINDVKYIKLTTFILSFSLKYFKNIPFSTIKNKE